MNPRESAWILLADAKRARLLTCQRARLGRTHLEEKAELAFDWPGHEHNRPMPLAGKSANTYAATRHDIEEELRRFARQVADWLVDRCRTLAIDRVQLFAPPRFLAELRKALPGVLNVELFEHGTDLINLPSGQLHAHRAIRELIGL